MLVESKRLIYSSPVSALKRVDGNLNLNLSASESRSRAVNRSKSAWRLSQHGVLWERAAGTQLTFLFALILISHFFRTKWNSSIDELKPSLWSSRMCATFTDVTSKFNAKLSRSKR